MKYFTLLLLTSWLFGCANLGDGQINPEFSDEFKETYSEYKPLIKDIAAVMVVQNPSKAAQIVTKLERARTNVTEFDLNNSYSPAEAVEKTKEYLLAECGVWCTLTTTRPYVLQVGAQLDRIAEIQSPTTSELTVLEVIDELIAAFGAYPGI